MTTDNPWNVYAVCICGWNIEATHGDLWFAQKRYPVCPECGLDARCYKREVRRWTSSGFERRPSPVLNTLDELDAARKHEFLSWKLRSYGSVLVLAAFMISITFVVSRCHP